MICCELRLEPGAATLQERRDLRSRIERGVRASRSLRRWTILVLACPAPHVDTRVVLLAERYSPVVRVDNVYAAWLRMTQGARPVGAESGRRAEWSVHGDTRVWADARLLPQVYDDVVSRTVAAARELDAAVLVGSNDEPLVPALLPSFTAPYWTRALGCGNTPPRRTVTATRPRGRRSAAAACARGMQRPRRRSRGGGDASCCTGDHCCS